jgi:alpha-L-rhamnosidase
MLPDGTVNLGEMTSFNHYALGAVGDWMHRTIAGISPLEPGYARVLLAPRPGGGLTWARGSLKTPHGVLAVDWRLSGSTITVDVDVPKSVVAVIRVAGDEHVVTGGRTHYTTFWDSTEGAGRV